MSARYFGAAVQRLEDPRLLAGKGRYVDDISLPGVLHASFLRAQVAHGGILSVDAAEARTMPGVAAIYTMPDFSAIAQGPMPPMAPHPLIETPINYHPLAVEEVHHVGEAIAIVLADTRQQAEDATNAMQVEMEVLPAVADATAALADGAPRVHSGRDTNLVGTLRGAVGDAGAVFAKA